MLFQSKIDRAMALQRERSGRNDEQQPEQDLSEQMEKGDLFAMLLSSLFVLVLPASLVLIALVFVACLLFGIP